MTATWNKDYNQKAAKEHKYIFVSSNQTENKKVLIKLLSLLTGINKKRSFKDDEILKMYKIESRFSFFVLS